MTEEKGIVKYQARDGQEITLGFEIVRQYLVSGKKELVTSQELMFFMGLCKSRGLNPFKKDAYLIKYSQDPAAIVTSIDFYRSRARAQKDCKGWRKGIIVMAKPEGVKEREGTLLLEGETLLGGWFEAKPDGWDFPLHHTVNLRGYIKKRSDGSITRFWEADNQPSQIMKVAEAQGLRMAWPDEFQQLYSDEEILADKQDPDSGMTAAAEAEEKEREEAILRFRQKFPDPDQIGTFLEKTAEANRSNIEDVMAAAGKDEESLKGFSAVFEKWLAKQPKKEEEKKEEGASDPLPKPSAIDRVKKLKGDDPQTYDYISRMLNSDGMGSESISLLFLREVEALKNDAEKPPPPSEPQGKMVFNSKTKRYEAIR